MMRVLFIIFVFTVLIGYIAATWFGWEVMSSGSRSRLGFPFTRGYYGGK